PEGRFHLKMVKIATSNRDNMVKQVRMLTENISVPETIDVSTILLFHENAMQSLAVCLENMMKSHQYAKQVFLEESKQVIADVNELGRLLGRIVEPINERKSELEAFEKSRNLFRAIENSVHDSEKEINALRRDEENLVLLKKEIEQNQKSLSLLKDGKPMKQYQEEIRTLALLEDRAGQVEHDINALVLPLNKVLNRLKQLSESGRFTLKSEVRSELYQCLLDPKSVNPEFFYEVKGIIESGILNLATDQTDKMLEQLRLAGSSFAGQKKQYQSLQTDIRKKKEEISQMDIVHKEKDLTDAIRSLQDRLTHSEKGLEARKKRLVTLGEDIESKKRELQENVSIIDDSKRISFSS
ncbi:MAG TPA: hypothetical protein VIO11_10090, partial [Candidatus Methanoperedens sp.]